MNVNELISEQKLFEVLNRYSPRAADEKGTSAAAMGDILLSMLKKTSSSDIIIPVIGVQGMGKSTLINAMIGEDILPNDADETTCVPVEIKYGEQDAADVFFSGSDRVEKAATKEQLAVYVDNLQNPGNEKKVSHIVLYRQNDLLKNGTVIVDLPGMGSLTPENEKTTNRYIADLSAGIFVIPTNPTIRRKEEIFIKSVWQHFPSMLFVQNAWNDEIPADVKEAEEYNSVALNKIASDIGVKFDNGIKVVNAYAAICGRLENDYNKVERSGLNALIAAVKTLSENWSETLKSKSLQRAEQYTDSAIKMISNELDKLGKDREEVIADNRAKAEAFRNETEKYEQVIKRLRGELSDMEDKVRGELRTIAKNCADNIRLDTFKLIDGGLVDGEKLSKAFSDIQTRYKDEACSLICDAFAAFRFDVTEKLGNLAVMIEEENRVSFDAFSFNSKEAFKGEILAGHLLQVGGGVGGVIVGSIVGDAVTGAIAGSAGGPIGIAVGLLAGLAVSALGMLFKRGVNKAGQTVRANKTKSEIEPLINEVEKTLRTQAQDQLEKTVAQIRSGLKEYIAERKAMAEKMSAEVNNILPAENESVLRADLEYLTEFKKGF